MFVGKRPSKSKVGKASEKIADFFDGEIYKKIRGNFTDERDVALSFSTDGFRPYKTKKTEKD